MLQTNIAALQGTAQGPMVGSALVAVAITVAIALAVIVSGVCVVVWLAIRNSRPQDRPAVLDAVARVLTAVAAVLNRSRRR